MLVFGGVQPVLTETMFLYPRKDPGVLEVSRPPHFWKRKGTNLSQIQTHEISTKKFMSQNTKNIWRTLQNFCNPSRSRGFFLKDFFPFVQKAAYFFRAKTVSSQEGISVSCLYGFVLFCFGLFCFVLVWFGLFVCLFVCLFPKIGVSQNGWFIMENPIKKWMIWGYHYFLERSVWFVWFVCLVCLFGLFVCLFGLFGLVWFGLFWFVLFCLFWFVCLVCLFWFGLVWFGVVWFVLVCFVLVCFVLFVLFCFVLVCLFGLFGLVWFGLFCFGLFVWFVWFGLFGLVWFGLVWFVLVGLFEKIKSKQKNPPPKLASLHGSGPRDGRLRHESFDERLEAAFVPAGPGGLDPKNVVFFLFCVACDGYPPGD